jgi:O-antigen/teichoic acid export membrane protein
MQISLVAKRLFVTSERGELLLFRTLVGNAVGVIFGLIFVVHYKMGALGAILASTCGRVIIAMLNTYLVKDYLGGYLYFYSDRLILEKFVPIAIIGIYSIANRFANIFKLIVNSISTALAPNYNKLALRDQKKAIETFYRISTKWTGVISIFYLGIILFSDEAIRIMTPPAYHSAIFLVPILTTCYIFRGLYGFANKPLFFLKKTRIIASVTFIAGICNVVLNLIFIPLIGVYGAAITSLIAFILTFCLVYYLSNKISVVKIDWKSFFVIFLPLFLVSIFYYYLQLYVWYLRIPIKMSIFIIFLAYLLYFNMGDIRKEITESFLKVKVWYIERNSIQN